MSAPVYAIADFVAALQNLLPQGRAWNRESGSVQGQLESGLVSPVWRVNVQDAALLVDAFPQTAQYLLEEWEAALGLPDPCAGPATTIAERRAQVVAKLTDGGGQSKARFIAFAAMLGYEITIDEFAPFRCGASGCGDGLGDEDWWFVWQVNAPGESVHYFEAGQGSAGDPLSSSTNAVLECAVENRAPAHTVVTFAYSNAVALIGGGRLKFIHPDGGLINLISPS